MLPIAEQYTLRHGSTEGAIRMFTADLMRGDAATLKAGYSLDNAIFAAADAFDVEREVVAELWGDQDARKQRLQALTDEFHRGKYADYDDSYAEFAATYGLTWDEDPQEEDEQGTLDVDVFEPIPRYAYTTHDETYSMVGVSDTIDDALNGVTGSVGEEYLMNPGFIIDLDTGESHGFAIKPFLTGATEKFYLFKKEQ